ncbi:hypothetical protein T492DRAFT_840146 [Pavlovales sp. CCMP2436]|nr:hypothetical protein T492DRAFT_840146 [Pavlovales sp. CCMP2436]
MSIIGETEVFFGGSRLSSVPELVSADDRFTTWNASGTTLSSYSSGMMKNLPMSQLKDDLLIAFTTSALPRRGRIGSVNSTAFAAAAAEFVPINSSGMNGASSTFVNGDGYLNASGQVVGGVTGWRLRVGGENYGIVTDVRAEGRFFTTDWNFQRREFNWKWTAIFLCA